QHDRDRGPGRSTSHQGSAVMGMFDKLKGRGKKEADQAPDVQQDDDDLPDLTAPDAVPTLAQAAEQAHFRARETNTMPDAQLETEGLPSVNRRKASGKLINVLGLVVIIGVGAALIVAVNGEKQPTKKKASAV